MMTHPARDNAAPHLDSSLLLYGGTVLTMDGRYTVLRDAEVLIQRGRIASVGKTLTLMPGTRLLDVTGHLILPGLIQGHVHLGQTFFRGLGENRRLLRWLRERIWPLEAAHDDESAYWCALQGAAEALLAGTTTIQDIGIGPGAKGLLQAIADSGLRAVAGKCLMDEGDGLAEGLVEDPDAALAESEALGNEFDGKAGRIHYSVNPRFILSCSDTLWTGVSDLAHRCGWPIHTHALEQQDETEIVRQLKGGRDEIEYFDDYGVLDRDLRIAHGVWLDDGHYSRVADRRFSVVHCPAANLKLGSGVADIVAHRRAGIPVGLGCDGVACNNGFDAFEEIRLAALMQVLKHGPGTFSGREALGLATSEGARALALDDQVGSLEIGKRADLVVLSLDRPEMWAAPQTDLHDLVCYSASRANVRHVFVDGEQLVENGRLVNLDLDFIRNQAQRTRNELIRRSGVDL